MLSKIILAFPLFILLSSCFGFGASDTTKITDSNNSSGLELYDTGSFSLFLPSTWEILKDSNQNLPKPIVGNLELAVTSKTFSDGFANNLLILSQELKSGVSSEYYSVSNNVGSKDEYDFYQEYKVKDFTFEGGELSKLYIFEAKYNQNTPKVIYMQTAIVCENKGYFLTIALADSVKNTSKYENILKTFTCK